MNISDIRPEVYEMAARAQARCRTRFEEIDADIAAFNGDLDAFDRLERLSHRQRHLMVHDWCEGCGRCAARCKQHAIRIVDGRARVDASRCVFCGYCARVCPQFCIKVV